MVSQGVSFAIDVIDNARNITREASGIRKLNNIASANNTNIKENWVPDRNRAYLNQRALTPAGDSKCSVASLAMILAMNGKISHNTTQMQTKPNDMWQDVKIPSGSLLKVLSTSRVFN